MKKSVPILAVVASIVVIAVAITTWEQAQARAMRRFRTLTTG